MPATSTYGIIGNPVEHSLSPLMHNAAFEALGIDAEYKLFPLEADELASFFEDLKQKDNPVFGLNVTIPYKEAVIAHLDTLTPLARNVGAVNTIAIDENRKLTGYNTDAPGFIAHLTELNFDAADKRIVILGAGGSARAILTALCLVPEKPQSIKIYNRTVSRAEKILSDLESRMNMDIVEFFPNVDDLNIELCDLLINTTSVGMKADDPVIVEQDMLHSDMLVYDLIYNPTETVLLKMARDMEAQTANGLGLLFYQGVLAFQHWAGVELEEGIKMEMRAALEKGAKK